jgi:hypothetical protein
VPVEDTEPVLGVADVVLLPAMIASLGVGGHEDPGPSAAPEGPVRAHVRPSFGPFSKALENEKDLPKEALGVALTDIAGARYVPSCDARIVQRYRLPA